MAVRSAHRTSLAGAALLALAGWTLAGCSSAIIESGRFVCIDDADCAWGWECRAHSDGRFCVHPLAPLPSEPLTPQLDPLGFGLRAGQPHVLGQCGNGRLETGEMCDAGGLNSLLPDAPCRPDCRLPHCGDGVKDAHEACDDDSLACNPLSCELLSPSKLEAHPPALHLGVVGLEAEGPRYGALLLYNPTPTSRSVRHAALVGCSSEFSLEPSPELTESLAPGTARDLAVKLLPRAAGVKSCLLRVDATDGQILVPITAAVGQRAYQTDRFLQQETRLVDILFVVDPRQPMTLARQRVTAAAAAFADVAAATRTDFHLASTSSVEASFEIFGQLHGDPRFVSRESARTSTEIATELRTRIDLPIRSGQQRGVDAVLQALSPALTASVDPTSCQSCSAPDLCAAGGCRRRNWGFRRQSASLEIVVLTDSPDASTASVRQAFTSLRELADPLLGNTVRIHGLLPTAGCAPHEQAPPWDELVRVTGGGRHDLCAKDAESATRSLAQQLFGPLQRFFLSRAAIASSIEVEVDGRSISAAAVSYDPASNSVVFAEPPAEGALVTVRYQVDS